MLTTFTNGIPTQYTVQGQVSAGGMPQTTTLAQMNLSYDSRGRVYAASDLVGTLEQLRYDKDSNLTRVIDGNGNTTKLTYGANSEPTGVI